MLHSANESPSGSASVKELMLWFLQYIVSVKALWPIVRRRDKNRGKALSWTGVLEVPVVAFPATPAGIRAKHAGACAAWAERRAPGQ